jgi:hypothetical protein
MLAPAARFQARHGVRSPLARIALFAMSAVLVSACETTPPGLAPAPQAEPELESFSVDGGGLVRANPLDVVVLPIEARLKRTDLPLEYLRQSIAKGLIRLRYSPLSFGYVDARTIDAAYTPGELNEQATLRIVITGWDDSLWTSHARIDVTASVDLVDARRPGESLWGGPVTTTVDLNPRREVFATNAALVRAACDQLADTILAPMPPRRPEVATPR